MNRFRRKKSKAPIINQGSQQVHKERNTSILVSESRSFCSSAIYENSTVCELDKSFSRRVNGLPIKKLLDEEMSKETEIIRRSPSVVARLMGFDGLPSQQTSHGQQKTSKSRTATGLSEMRRNGYEYQSHTRCSMENPEFKDVYEVSDAKKCAKHNYSESDINFVSEKFMDAKHLSANNRFHNSKEFSDTLDEVDVNKDLLIKFLQQPDSLCRKHLHDLQGDLPMYVSCRAQPILEKCENKTKGTSPCNTRCSRKQLDCLSPISYSSRSSNRNSNSFEIGSNEQHERGRLQTRIVVLKPNLEKLQKAKKPGSSHRKHVEYSSDVSDGAGQLRCDNGFSRPNMRESREIAKEITRRMRKNNGNEPIDLPSIFQGYAGDESSYSVSGSESGSELEERMLSSRKSFHWTNRRNTKSSYARESSISREAKKRLSKRWNTSQTYHDDGSVSEVSNLGEMLGKPDREMRRDKLDPMLVPHMNKGIFFVDDNKVSSPLCIDYRDDERKRHIKSGSKSGFVSDSSASCYSPKSKTHFRVHNHGRKLVPKELAYIEKSKEFKENVYTTEDFSFRNQRSGNPKAQFPDKRDDNVEKEQYDLNVGEIITSQEVSLVSKVPVCNANSPWLTTEAEVGVGRECKAFSRGSSDEFSVKPSPSLLGVNDSLAPGPEDSKQQIESAEELVHVQWPAPESESPTTSKDTDHPSPISVLKAPLTDDISPGSECFESVSAGLQELRMQLKLLRMESEAGGNNLVLSDKDNSQGSFSDIDEDPVLEYATWQTSYIDDTLKKSGFDSTDPNMIVALWHSLEFPIGLRVFDELEKKYFEDKMTSKSDRRLLFYRINCGLGEIFWSLVDPHPWVNTGRRKLSLGLAKNGVLYELEKLLLDEENDTAEKMLDKEMEWFDYGDEVDDIGQELENILMNDLIDELSYVYAF